MNTATAPLVHPTEPRTLSPEDSARADLYALLARLWYGAPDAALLETLAGAHEAFGIAPQGAFLSAWQALCNAARGADQARVREEYDGVFIGVGKAPVTLFATHYLGAIFKERILVQLRDELAALELGRAEFAHEPEDHLAALCDVMRHMIAADCSDAALQRQRQFFSRYIAPVYKPLVRAVGDNEATDFYRRVADVAQAFFDIEAESFEML
jgi:TorA maturation chaperone TorD